MQEKIVYDLTDSVALIRLNDPSALNATTPQMAEEFIDALARAAREARAVLITGEGRAFCAGANLATSGADISDPTRDAGRSLEKIYNPLVLEMRNLSIPIVAAVNGPAVGVGCAIALSADIIVAAESAYFYQAFAKVGLVPDGGSSFLLTRSVSRARAMEMMLLAPKIDAATALAWGLINRVTPDADLVDTALAIAKQLSCGPSSLGIIRQLAWIALDSTYEQTLIKERYAQRDASRSEDFAEGVVAFREKRSPAFRGR